MKILAVFLASFLCLIYIIKISETYLNCFKSISYNLTILSSSTSTMSIKIISSTDFYPCIAVLVEFRTTDMLVTVVHNVNHHIPSTWPIQIFHGSENENFIRNSTLAPLLASGKIFLTRMDEVYGKSRTNELLTSSHFWQRVRGEKILFFQIDSIMCSNSPHKITDYLQYDYIGAPWDPSWFAFSKVDLVGNGGFSLRSRSKILALLVNLRYNRNIPEDVWYGLNLRRVNASVAPMNIAKTFAVESIFYERPLGIHRFNLACPLLTKLFETCPEAILVMPRKCR